MIELLQANWLWILLGIGLLWFLFSRRGHGMGGHGSHEESNRRPTTRKEEERVIRKRGGC
jgi:hypothetical protein